jgi:hypothetical protein
MLIIYNKQMIPETSNKLTRREENSAFFSCRHDNSTKKITNKINYIDLFIIPSRLYMFRAMFSPISRSTWLYLVVFTQVAAGWCPRHQPAATLGEYYQIL